MGERRVAEGHVGTLLGSAHDDVSQSTQGLVDRLRLLQRRTRRTALANALAEFIDVFIVSSVRPFIHGKMVRVE